MLAEHNLAKNRVKIMLGIMLKFLYKKVYIMPHNFECSFCGYKTTKKSSFNNHLLSKKHQRNCSKNDSRNLQNSRGTENVPSGTEIVPKGTENVPNVCEYCGKVLSYKKTLSRHKKTCKFKDVVIEKKQLETTFESDKNDLTEKLEEQQEMLQKQNKKLEKFKEMKDDYMKLLKQIAQSKVKGNTMNMYYIINHFNDAYNFEDLMKPELTDKEKKKLDELEPLSGSIYVIENRCITDMDVKKRPIHCLDTARDKYLLRTNNAWVVDHKAKKIFSKVSSHIYKHYLLDPQDPKYTIDEILKNQQQLIRMEGKSSQIKLMKDLNDKVYIKNIAVPDES